MQPDSDSITTLVEKNVMKVNIAQMPPEAVTANLRNIGELSGVREGAWKQLCDYLIVCRDGNGSIAILVELKKNLKNDYKGQEQLRRSLPLLEYLRSICRTEYYPKKSETLTVRYFLIGKKLSERFDKQHVRPDLKVEKKRYKNIEIHLLAGRNRISFDELIS